jgi:plasmid maintenance system antidote protein VapI
MKNIDSSSPESALDYLRSLPARKEIEIINGRVALTNAATDAVSVIAGQSAYEWATLHNRWDWTAGELIDAMERELGDSVYC